ncbi:MAG: DnaJ domain-containing protein [Pseudomonadota bacterium]
MNRPPDDAIPQILTLEGLEKAALEPEEAFVLSRVNGTNTLTEIGQMLGYDTARVWNLLDRAAEAGIVGVGEGRRPVAPKRAKGSSILDQLDEEERSPELSKIPRSQRNDIRLRHTNMVTQTHYEVLGVPRSSSFEWIKKKYLELVKEFHPDRFFGQELGHYKEKLEALFERITSAYDELSDPDRRRAYDESFEKGPKPKPSGKVQGPPRDLLSRMAAAKRHFEMGKTEEKAGNFLKAANFFQMAVYYDPTVKELREAWERTRPHIHRRKADELFAEAEDRLFRGDETAALALFEEAHELNPRKRECYRELTMLYLKRGKIERAKEKGVHALEFFPNDPRVHGAMGLIYKEMGNKKGAIRELRLALRLDETMESLGKVLKELEGSNK